MINDIEANQRTTNWAALVRKLLCNLGFYDVWLQQGVGDTKLFLNIVKQRLRDQFFQTWNEELENSSRAFFLQDYFRF